LQPSGSFKDRGVGHLCQSILQQQQQQQTLSSPQTKNIQLVSSSGGNAGLAVATLGKQLGMAVHVVVPTTTKTSVVDKLQTLNARVTVHGDHWNAADVLARQMVEDANTEDVGAHYISPYDHPLLWTGHSSVVDEIFQDLKDFPPAAILLSVGGGGLLCGVLQGLQRNQLKGLTVVAAETQGAASFAASWQANEMVRLDKIDTIATSLGALQVTPETLLRSNEYQVSLSGKVVSAVCTDAEAVQACLAFANDHRLLVEPACGAALAVLYSERLRAGFLKALPPDNAPVVVEVCGGSGVSLDLLQQWKQEFL
jgi:L-serine/L-threonine ammonia-lyase